MRNNSTNIFNDGLNYDLNPMTTPNNVLTDCVNGTFVTFNGDELALQNDAGNTKIAIPGSSPTEYVDLSPGFYPLGIKEHGGVLYIISAKLPDLSAGSFTFKDEVFIIKGNWQENTQYQKNDIVIRESFGVPLYYLALVGNSDKLSTLGIWDKVGELKDFNNRFSEVEFGSYPSPEASGKLSFDGIEKFYTPDTTLDALYKKSVINDAFFKTTRYVTFESEIGPNGANMISGFKSIGPSLRYDPSFYKIRLYHQLDNGYLDLTDNIWLKYHKYLEDNNLSSTGRFWFTDRFFRYYCPSQYKGKLALSLEIEDLESFKLVGFPGFTFEDSEYVFIANVEGIGTPVIGIPYGRVEIWIDGEPYDFGNDIYFEDILFTENYATFTLSNIDLEFHDKELKYRITPIIEVEGIKYAESKYNNRYNEDNPSDPIENLPQEYVDKFVIEGSRLINNLYDDIDFILVEGSSDCLTGTLDKLYKEVILTDKGGNYLNDDLIVTQDNYVFLHKDELGAGTVGDWESSNSNKYVIATYDVLLGTTKPNILTVYKGNLPETVLSIFKGIDIRVRAAEECAPVYPSFVPTLIGIDANGKLTLLNESGGFKQQNYPGFSFSSMDESKHTCMDYDKTDKLVFIGGKNGELHIFDVNNPQAVIHKTIRVYSDNIDLSCVNVIRVMSGTTLIRREILIGHGNNRAYKQKYYSSISSYVDLIDSTQTGGFQNSNVGNIRKFHYYGGNYYAISNDLEFFRSDDLTQQWKRFKDSDTYGYNMAEGTDKLWYVAGLDKGSNKSEIIYWAYKNTYNDLNGFRLVGNKNIRARDIEMLRGDESLILSTNVGDGLWRIGPGPQMNVTRLDGLYTGHAGSCYYGHNNAYLYTGGAKFDGNKYAYIGVQEIYQNKFSYSIMKYNAYPSNPFEVYMTCIPAPSLFYKIYLY